MKFENPLLVGIIVNEFVFCKTFQHFVRWVTLHNLLHRFTEW